jgi:glycosyltransferase involved in cell wall biosynthesis
MNILFLTQILPFPPDAGPKVKTWNVIRFLAGMGYSITLVSFVRAEETAYTPELEKICHAVHVVPIRRSLAADVGYMIKSYLSRRPFLVERDDLFSMQDIVNKLVKENDFDFIHADQLTMVQFAIRGASAFPDKKPKVIFDAHNAVWAIVERMQENARWFLKPVLGVEARRVKRYEGELLKTVDQVLAVTDMDRAGLEVALQYSGVSNNDRVAPVTVVPIAIDTRQLKPVKRSPGSMNIVTLGTLHYPPNADGIRWFFNEVFPLIRQRFSNTTLTIIGKNPPEDFLDLEAQNPDVIKVTGYVSDLVPYLEQSALMVVPVRAGGGMRVRILEAFAYAMPVVTTTIGLEGIHAVLDQDVIVADTAIDFADRACDVLNDSSLQAELSSHGRQLAEGSYDWQVVLSAMNSIYAK